MLSILQNFLIVLFTFAVRNNQQLQTLYLRSVSIAKEKFSNGFVRNETLLSVVLAVVEEEEVAILSAFPFSVPMDVEIFALLFTSLFAPPDIPETRDPSLLLPSENGNFPPRGDLRLKYKQNVLECKASVDNL